MRLARLFSILLVIALQPLASSAAEIKLSIDYSEVPRIIIFQSSAYSIARFELNGYTNNNSPGDPAIPLKRFFAALPPEADETTVNVSLSEATYEELPGEYYIEPCPPFVAETGGERLLDWGPGKTIVEGKNTAVYNTNAFFPAFHIAAGNMGKLRNWKFIEINLFPFRYNPITKKIVRLLSGDIVISYQQQRHSTFTNQFDLAYQFADKLAEQLAVNYNQAKDWYSSYSKYRGIENFSNPEGLWDYVIVTRSSIVNASTELGNFIAHRQSMGMNVYLATESVWGGGTGDAAANSIRNWLKNNYLSKGIQYVLFIGNPNPSNGDVPMKMLWPRKNATSYTDYRDAPSDYFYADLTGNWDRDGDGYYGEEDHDFGTGGIDRIPEVIVGRIPYYGSISDLDSILRKIINYDNEMKSNDVRRMILPMVPSDPDTPGYHLGEAIKNDIASPYGYSWTRLYKEPYGLNPPPEVIPSSYENVKNQWNIGAGFIFWWTHGTESTAFDVFRNSDCQYLDNTKPTFTFQCSCLNGKPENTQNLGYSILKRGGIATVSASRVSWYYPGQTVFNGSGSNAGIAYEYAKSLCANLNRCGNALYNAKLAVTQGPWMNHCVFNLYGDPVTKWISPTGDVTPPTTPVVEASILTTETNQLSASWSSEDPESQIAEYQYAIGTTEGGTDVRNWTSTGTNTSATVSVPLNLGTVYFFSVKAKNNAGLWSNVGVSRGTCRVSTVCDRNPKSIPEGTVIGVPSAVASMNYGELGNELYLQSEDRSNGFKTVVSNVYGQIEEGTIAVVVGTVNNTGNEWQLNEAKVWSIGSVGAPEPLFASNRNIGGATVVKGGARINEVSGASGLNNVGLLMQTSGIVTGRNTTDLFFYIDDGSRVWDGSGYYGIRVECPPSATRMPALGQKVVVFGISSVSAVGTQKVRTLKIRRQSDIQIIP